MITHAARRWRRSLILLIANHRRTKRVGINSIGIHLTLGPAMHSRYGELTQEWRGYVIGSRRQWSVRPIYKGCRHNINQDHWIIIWRSLGARQTRRIPGGLDWKRGFFAVYLCFYLCCGVLPLAAHTMFLTVPF